MNRVIKRWDMVRIIGHRLSFVLCLMMISMTAHGEQVDCMVKSVVLSGDELTDKDSIGRFFRETLIEHCGYDISSDMEYNPFEELAGMSTNKKDTVLISVSFNFEGCCDVFRMSAVNSGRNISIERRDVCYELVRSLRPPHIDLRQVREDITDIEFSKTSAESHYRIFVFVEIADSKIGDIELYTNCGGTTEKASSISPTRHRFPVKEVEPKDSRKSRSFPSLESFKHDIDSCRIVYNPGIPTDSLKQTILRELSKYKCYDSESFAKSFNRHTLPKAANDDTLFVRILTYQTEEGFFRYIIRSGSKSSANKKWLGTKLWGQESAMDGKTDHYDTFATVMLIHISNGLISSIDIMHNLSKGWRAFFYMEKIDGIN